MELESVQMPGVCVYVRSEQVQQKKALQLQFQADTEAPLPTLRRKRKQLQRRGNWKCTQSYSAMTRSTNENKSLDELDAPPTWWDEAEPIEEDWQDYPLHMGGDSEYFLVTQPGKGLGA